MNRIRLLTRTALMIVLIPSAAKAQSGFLPLTDLQIFGSATMDFRQNQTNLKDAEGSQYLEDTYTAGNVLMNNVMYEGVLLRYDIYNDLFEARLGTHTVAIDPVKNSIDTLYYRDYKFVRKFLQPGKNNRLSHVVVLYTCKENALFKKFKVAFIPATNPSAYTEAKPAKINPVLPDYFLGNGEELVLIKGVKSIADFFKVEPKRVKSIIKSQQLDLRSEEDLRTICSEFTR